MAEYGVHLSWDGRGLERPFNPNPNLESAAASLFVVDDGLSCRLELTYEGTR